ncbi:hypothetical protein EVA_13345 [gut metagenome]|uniref:Uncharacterized protein n=1 Tax=gut metagenome TaxID=749906 RepID=J9GGR3_9ZZZZ
MTPQTSCNKLYANTIIQHAHETSLDKGICFPSETCFIYTNHSKQL